MSRVSRFPILFVLILVVIMVAPITFSATIPLLLPIKPGTYYSDLRPGVSTRGYWSWNDYPYAVPFVTPIKVVVAKDVLFSNFKGPITLSFTTPTGEFSRILMRVDIWMESAVPGRTAVNYDRPIWVWVNGVPAYVGTTVQRYNQTGFADVTHLYSLLVGGKRANVTVALPNWVIPKWGLTGMFHVRITLLYYPGERPSVPDIIIPLFDNTKGTSWKGIAKVVLNSKRPSVTQEIKVPSNTVKAFLLVYTEGSSYEEFWYANTPPDRYLIFKVDNTTIAFLQPYPYIFTGGINPLLWRPISSIRTYAFVPHIIDLTPFLPMLVGSHNLTLEIYNTLNYWHVFSALLLYTDSNAYFVTGKIISYEFSGPVRNYKELTTNNTQKFYINSSMSLKVKSLITVYSLLGSYSYVVSEHMWNCLKAVQSANDVWFNMTLKQKWLYTSSVLNVEPSWASPKVSYSWSDNWTSMLSINDMFYVETKESPEHASAQHPVEGNFSLHDWISQELSVIRNPWPFTLSFRSLNISVNATAYINGTIMFISPTGAIITGITSAGGNTTKSLSGVETLGKFVYEMSREVSGGNRWPHWWISEDITLFKVREVS